MKNTDISQYQSVLLSSVLLAALFQPPEKFTKEKPLDDCACFANIAAMAD